jgi:single-stranded DNA-binding protein
MNTKLEIEAECSVVGPIQEFKSGFRKRTIVLREQFQTTEGKPFEKLLAVELKKDLVDLVGDSTRGKRLKVTGYVESRAWENPNTGKTQYFTEFSAKEIAYANEDVKGPAPAKPTEADLFADDIPF